MSAVDSAAFKAFADALPKGPALAAKLSTVVEHARKQGPATGARRIARIREEPFSGTRQVLRGRFKRTGSGLNNLLTLVKSDFDVSINEAPREPRSPSRSNGA